jgi:2,4-dienoyl-CoA reductase-like NADH-dependent reductase (Old Yellow Enzyme family)
VRDRVNCKVCYIGGVSTLKSMETAMQEFDFIQMGRALIKDPSLVRHASADSSYVNACNHCNRCAGMIKNPNGIRCVLNDS